MWSGTLEKRRNFRLGTGFKSEIGLSKDYHKRVKTENTSAETLTEISECSHRKNYSRLNGLTIMNDDFKEREICYT